MKITKKKIEEKLAEVIDPELGISIVDLGLIYQIEAKKNSRIKIIMTLTTIGCPLFSLIEQEIRSKLSQLGLKEKDFLLELTFDPPWSIQKLSDRAKAQLGI